MKIRNGFVSNSSSASFVIDTKLEMQDFFAFLVHQVGFNKEFIVKELEKEIIYLEKVSKRYDVLDMKSNKQKIKQLKRDIKKIQSSKNEEEVIRLYFKFKGLSIAKNFYDFASINGFTSMWNDDSSMGETCCAIIDKMKKQFGKNQCLINVFGEQ